jgi:hypothetical protein
MQVSALTYAVVSHPRLKPWASGFSGRCQHPSMMVLRRLHPQRPVLPRSIELSKTFECFVSFHVLPAGESAPPRTTHRPGARPTARRRACGARSLAFTMHLRNKSSVSPALLEVADGLPFEPHRITRVIVVSFLPDFVYTLGSPSHDYFFSYHFIFTRLTGRRWLRPVHSSYPACRKPQHVWSAATSRAFRAKGR